MNSNSTLLAAAVSSLVALHAAPVRAADPGACCTGLDERVAELEATSARKDNRAVALSITGEVSRALLIWDDGARPDADPADNAALDEARISPASKSGFIVELGFTDSPALFVNQASDAGKSETSFEARLANWYVEGERNARQSVNQPSSAADGTAVIDLSRAHTEPVTWHNASLGFGGEGGDYTGLAWGNVAWGLESDKGDVPGRDSPVFYGFLASAAWGENDSWDVALRFQKDLSAVRGTSGAGYLWVSDESTVSLYPNGTVAADGSISVMHVPSGLFGNVAGNRSDLAREALAASGNPNPGRMWTAQAGAEKPATSRGATALYGGYHEVLLGYAGFNGNASPTPPGGATHTAASADTDVSRWGVGTVQQFDAAALEMYAVFNHFEANKTQTKRKKARAEPWYGVVVGSRL